MHKKQKYRLIRIFGNLIVSLLIIVLALTANPILVLAQENCLECHNDQSVNVSRSVHRFLSCTSCHANITGYPHPEGASLDKKESVATCSGCHEGRITESYADSFHGKAVYLGSRRSASCVDCHGAHQVLRSGNPESKVAKENVPQTCANCHGKASPGFADGSEHFKLTATGPGAPMFYTAKFFVWLTILTITALVIHIEMQLYQNLRTILDERKK